jgi:exocyst complex component 5
VTSFWNRAFQAISLILEGRNNDLFFMELGLGLHSILLEHLKKFTINAAGGLILTK